MVSKKKNPLFVRVEYKNLSLVITVCHHSASLVMPNSDPRDGFFYPTLAGVIDSYITSQSTIFQSCQDESSWVEPVLSSG